MKVILKDFNFNGKHINEYECDFPQLHDFEDIPEGKLLAYMYDEMSDIENFTSSFKEEKAQ